jgi:glucans biosynthesis protein C
MLHHTVTFPHNARYKPNTLYLPMGKKTDRAIWLDYLRAFITVLVVAHHSSLAYTTFASFNKQAYNASTHPIVDTARAFSLDIFEDFNDVFFMALMFLISGIFVLPAIARKGTRTFVRDRFFRLFIPFVIAVTFLMPLGYLSSWHLAHGNYDLHAFLVDYIKIEHWPAGPPWFIGILFLFNLIVAAGYRRWQPVLNKASTRLASLSDSPASTG